MKSLQNHMTGIVLSVLLFAMPVGIIFKHYTAARSFLTLIYFGQNFQHSALPEVKKISPVAMTPVGYDGQFYAQLALRPGLRGPELARALDNPPYRSMRIGMPVLAFCLGLGKPAWILNIYALLNFFFWVALLAAIARIVGFSRPKDVLLAFALLWSTGTLTSVARSLTDLPATVLGVFALFSDEHFVMAALLLGASGLIKETSALSFTAIPLGDGEKRFDIKRLLVSSLILFLPVTSWFIYTHIRFQPGPVAGCGNFASPFSGLALKLWDGLQGLSTGFHSSPSKLLESISELVAPLSLLVQAIYLVTKPRFQSKIWRFGIGFALLIFVLGKSVWAEQFAYCRVLLPLTFSFNLLIHEHEENSRFLAWYLAGNVGMYAVALQTVLRLVIPI